MAPKTNAPEESPTRRAVREMTSKGLNPRQISAVLGISTQMVYRHLYKIRANGKKAS